MFSDKLDRTLAKLATSILGKLPVFALTERVEEPKSLDLNEFDRGTAINLPSDFLDLAVVRCCERSGSV